MVEDPDHSLFFARSPSKSLRGEPRVFSWPSLSICRSFVLGGQPGQVMESVIGVMRLLDPSGRIPKIFNGPHWPACDILQRCSQCHITTRTNRCLLPVKCTAAQGSGIRKESDVLTSTNGGPGQLAVAVIPSACDGHQIKELNSSAEVGTVCVAVVRQSAEQASREIWRAAGGGSAALNKNRARPGDPPGISSLSASISALRLRLRRHVQTYASRGIEGTGRCGEACLLLYCKLAGGTLMASPLDGHVFRLREEAPIVEAGEGTTRKASNGIRKVRTGDGCTITSASPCIYSLR